MPESVTPADEYSYLVSFLSNVGDGIYALFRDSI